MSPSHVSPAGLVTRQRRRFRSCSIDITAYHLAGTEHPDALTAAKGKGTFRKQRSPISLVAATPRRVRFWPVSDLTTPKQNVRWRPDPVAGRYPDDESDRRYRN